MRGLGIAVVALALTGCATPSIDRRPPSLERALVALDAGESCATYWRTQRAPNSPLRRSELVERCPARFPDVLLAPGIEGACRSMFDRTDDGRIVNIETRCAAEAAYETGRYEDAWRALGEALFEASVDRSFERYRLVPEALDPETPHTDLSVITFFTFAGDREVPALVPPPFERGAPASR
jgi:hypothetical protein